MSVRRLDLPRDCLPREAAAPAREHEFGRSLVALLNLGAVDADAVSGRRVTRATGWTVGRDGAGKYLLSDGASAPGSFDVDLSAYSKIAVGFDLWWDGYADDYDMAMEYTTDGVLNAGFYVIPNHASGRLEVAVGSAGGVVGSQRFARPTAGTWHRFIVNMDRAQSYAGVELYVDGELQTPFPGEGISNTPGGNFATSTLYLLNRGNSSLVGAGRLRNLFLLGGRSVSAAEARRDYANQTALYAAEDLPVPILGGTGPQTVAIAQAAEADAAQALTAAQRSAIGQPSEADLAQAFTAAQRRAVGQVLETNVAQPVSSAQARAVAQTVETDAALSMVGRQAATIGQPAETDAALTFTQAGSTPLGIASEADQAQPMGQAQARAIGQVAEACAAQPLVVLRTQAVGLVLEIDVAQSMGLALRGALGHVAELDSALPFAVAGAEVVDSLPRYTVHARARVLEVQAAMRRLEVSAP